jgi:hypothetical protein
MKKTIIDAVRCTGNGTGLDSNADTKPRCLITTPSDRRISLIAPIARKANPVKTICAWCHPWNASEHLPGSELVSHGICEMHLFAMQLSILLGRHDWQALVIPKLKTCQSLRLMEGIKV